MNCASSQNLQALSNISKKRYYEKINELLTRLFHGYLLGLLSQSRFCLKFNDNIQNICIY